MKKKIEMIGFVCETGCRERQGCEEGRRRDGGKDQRQLRDPLTVFTVKVLVLCRIHK
jgi:hypothetical protein